MKRHIILLVVVFIMLINIAYTYGQNNYPKRIISLAPYTTEQIYLLGAQDNLIGTTIYCQRPAEAKNKEKVATAIEVNLEKIVSMKPDLVLATPLTDRVAIEKLIYLNIKVIVFKDAKTFDGICEQFLELGKIIGKEEVAKKIINEAKKELGLIKEKTSLFSRPRVFIQVGARPLVTANKDYFINDFIEFAGGINIAKDSKGILYSREKVLLDNPQVIIIVSMGIATKEEKMFWQKYQTLDAVKNNRIYIADSNILCSPTPLSFIDGLKQIVNFLHPEN